MAIRDALSRNIGLKLLALILAVLLWFMAVGRERAEVGLTVPLEMTNFPPDMVIANQVPDGISLRIRGSVTITRQVADRRLRFSLDLSGAVKGSNKFTLLPSMLDLPRGIEVMRLAPNTVTVELEKLVTKSLSLLPVIKGEPVSGYIIEDISLEPRVVEVRGPESVLDGMEILWTEAIDVTQLNKPVTVATQPALSDPTIHLVTPVEIKAGIKISEKIVTKSFDDVPILPMQPAGDLKNFRLTPSRVDLVVRGPINQVEKLVVGENPIVRVNLAGLEPGSHERLVMVELPGSLEVVKVEPKVVQIEIDNPPSPPQLRAPETIPPQKDETAVQAPGAPATTNEETTEKNNGQ